MNKIKNIFLKCREYLQFIAHENVFEFRIKFLKFIFYDFESISNVPKNWKERQSIIVRTLMMWFTLINPFIYISSLLLEIFSENHDNHRIIFGVMAICLWSTLAFKMFLYTWKKKEILNLIESLKEFYPKNQSLITIKCYKQSKLLGLGSVMVLMLSVITVALIPLIVHLYNGDVVMPLPFPKTFFDPTQNFTYPFFYAWQLIVFAQGISISFGFHFMTYTITSTIALEWSILAQDFCKIF